MTVTEVISDANSLANVPKGSDDLLVRLQHQLLELEQHIRLRLTKAGKHLEVDPVAWTRHWTKTSKHLKDISKTMEYISIIFSASTYLQAARVDSRLRALSYMAESARNSQASATAELDRKVEGLTMLCNKILTSALSANEAEKILEPLRQSAVHNYDQEDSLRGKKGTLLDQPLTTPESQTIVPIHRDQQDLKQCLKSCRCQCHFRNSFTLPSMLRYWMGSLRVTITNSSLIQTPCNVKRCRRVADTKIALQYILPQWLSHSIISARFNSASAGPVERVIRLMQTYPQDAISFAMNGRLDDLRRLYIGGRASIHDVDPDGGDTIVVHAFMAGQVEVVRFLLNNGADLMQQNYAGFETRDILYEQFYGPWRRSHGGSELCAFVDVNEIEEGLELTLLHRIILGRSCRSLATELEEFPELVDVSDVHGRTPLFWAVWREDLAAVSTLLDYGADPGIAANDGSNIFHVITWSAYGEELFALISDRFAHRNSVRLPGSYLSTEKYYASTPWHNVISYNRTDLLGAFLEHKPDLRAKSQDGQALFQYAINYANADMLSALTTADLNGDGFEAVTKGGKSVMSDVITRFNSNVDWVRNPANDSETLVALVRFVSRGRQFLPQLPRLIFGSRTSDASEKFEYSLSDPNVDNTFGEEWYLKTDLEDCIDADGNLNLPWEWIVDDEERKSRISEHYTIVDEEEFFDAKE